MNNDDFDFCYDPNFNITNIHYGINSIISTIKTKCDNNEIDLVKKIILNQHELIFNYDNMENDNVVLIQELFKNKKFLTLFSDICGLIKYSKSELIFINKAVYDFFKTYKPDKYTDIRGTLLSITYIINEDRVRDLTPMLGIEPARELAIISYSSYIMESVIHRINKFMVTRIMEISIYNLRKLYELILDLNGYTRDVLNLFIYSMVESLSDQSNAIYINTFNAISDVLMSLLVDLDEVSLLDILKQYGGTITMMNIPYNKLRFSMRAVLEDVLRTNNKLNPKYQSIYDKIKYIEATDGIIIP